MDDVVIVGAFDRYNYGDNLMPILFEFFLKEFYPEFFKEYRLVFAALVDSDLSRFKVKKTVSMASVFKNESPSPKAIISIGGEVLCASSSTLFTHMGYSGMVSKAVLFLRRYRLKFVADVICRLFFRLPWEYPYIPAKRGGAKVALNTVGGEVSKSNRSIRFHSVVERMKSADFISVRDRRTLSYLQGVGDPQLFPDSAITMSHFCSRDSLRSSCGKKILSMAKGKYVCVQAAPKKAGASAEVYAIELKKIKEKYQMDIVLCPIGYASGHDDIEFLRDVKKYSGGGFVIADDLNIWEIMYAISQSQCYIGTSLHGVITALSFSVPHIGLNPKVKKLDAFLRDWSIGPSRKCYPIEQVHDVLSFVLNGHNEEMIAHCQGLVDAGLRNNHALVRSLGLVRGCE